MSEGESDESLHHTTNCTAASHVTPNITNTPPPPSNSSKIAGQPPHEPLEISTTIDRNPDSSDTTPTPTPTPTPTILPIASLPRSITTTTTTTTSTTTPAPTTPQLNTVTQLSQDVTVSSISADVVNTARARLLPALPSFLNYPGTSLCISILVLAKADGFENTLCHGQRTPWFLLKNDLFFADGGILCRYRYTQSLQLRHKFKEAENAAKVLFEGNAHQDDPSGEQDEGNLPIYARAFFEYFQYLDERTSTLNTQRANRMRHVRVNRSLIGQQPVLSPNADETTMNPTTAPNGRERGTGEVAGNIIINEIPIASSEYSATNIPHRPNNLPRRRAHPMMVEVVMGETTMLFSLHLYLVLQEPVVQ